MSRRRTGVVIVGLVCAAGCGLAFALLGRAGAAPAAASGKEKPVTASVSRSDMTQQQEVDGTLGFDGDYKIVAPSLSENSPGRGAGTLTWLPAIGQTIKRGQLVYAVDNRPVQLWYGSLPLWRDLSTGISDGPDVMELKQNLKALGFGAHLTNDDHFGWTTSEAVKKWQKAQDLKTTGRVAVGDVVVEPSAIRVSSLTGTLGSSLQGTVLTATSTTRVISVNLPATNASIAHRGDRVTVEVPGGGSAQGRVAEVGTVANAPAGAGGPEASPPGSATDKATITVKITLDDPVSAGSLDGAPVTVGFTSGAHRHVLSVPVTALLATVQGSYAVEVVADDGSTRLVAVTLGFFAQGNVEVASPDLHEGAKVVVAAS